MTTDRNSVGKPSIAASRMVRSMTTLIASLLSAAATAAPWVAGPHRDRFRNEPISRREAIPHSQAAGSPSPFHAAALRQTATNVSCRASNTTSSSEHLRRNRANTHAAWRSWKTRSADASRAATIDSRSASQGSDDAKWVPCRVLPVLVTLILSRMGSVRFSNSTNRGNRSAALFSRRECS